MIKKKVILLLNHENEKNIGLINYVNSNFHNCLVEVAFLTTPAKARITGHSTYIFAIVENAESNVCCDNHFRLFTKSVINAQDILHLSSYFDFLVASKNNYFSIYGGKNDDQEIQHPEIPLLLLPEINVGQVSNIIFVNSFPLKAIQTFKRFCYLFPEMCGNHEVVLLQLYQDNEPVEIEALGENQAPLERKFIEYFKAKCNLLSVHKTFLSLTPRDLLAINFNQRSLLVLNTQDKLAQKGLFSALYETTDNVSFSIAG